MWLIYENCEFRSDLESKKGDTYSGYVVTGTKKGWKDEPDAPYSKIFFDNHMVVVEDKKGGSAEMALDEFFEACEEGDLIAITSEKETGSQFWKIVSVKNNVRSILPESAKTSSAAQSDEAVDSGWNAAVNFVNVLVNNGHYKEKTAPEILLDAVVTYRMRFDALSVEEAVLEELEEAA